jgi:hypothetical protein
MIASGKVGRGQIREGPAMAAATEQTVTRVAAAAAALLRSIRDPGRPGHGGWNLAELSVHMLHVIDFELGTVRRDPVPAVGDFDELTRYTLGYVADEPCRDPVEVADRIEAAAAEYAALTAGVAADTEYDWFGGARLPQRAVHAHIVSELLVHGWDVARAEHRPWVIDRSDAIVAIDEFVVPLAAAFATAGTFGGAGAFVDPARAAGLRAVYDLMLADGPRRHLAFDDGELTITDPEPARRVDCHLRADPATLLLVVWGRFSPWPAVARGRLMAWGRRPWLAARLPSLIRTP